MEVNGVTDNVEGNGVTDHLEGDGGLYVLETIETGDIAESTPDHTPIRVRVRVQRLIRHRNRGFLRITTQRNL